MTRNNGYLAKDALFRGVCLTAAALYVAFGFVYRSSLTPHAPDPMTWRHRLFFAALFAAIAASTYLLEAARRHVWSAIRVLLMVATLDVARTVYHDWGQPTVSLSLLGLIALGNLVVSERAWTVAFDASVLGFMALNGWLEPNRVQGEWAFFVSAAGTIAATRGALWFRAQVAKPGVGQSGTTDAATGLRNRQGFLAEFERIRAAQASAQPDNLTPIGMVMGDVNGLKLANDAFGHGTGDILLGAVAHALQSARPPGSVVARLGGGEFAVIVPNATPAVLDVFVARVHEGCQRAVPGLPVRPNISLGWSLLSPLSDSPADALRTVDRRMYEAKRSGDPEVQSAMLSHIEFTLLTATGESEEHCRAVKAVAERIGRSLGLPDSLLEELGRAAFFHDIGKVGLTRELAHDSEVMRSHAELGYRIASAIPRIAPAATAILHHHECWDGSGYPGQLKGADIPLYSRVIALAEAVCVAAQAAGGTGSPSGQDAAIRHAVAASGSAFDPQLVNILVGLPPLAR